MTLALRSAVRAAIVLAALYGVAILLGVALLCFAFEVGLLDRIEILFYRGLLLTGAVALAVFALLVAGLRRFAVPTLRLRDALPAAAISLAFNVAFLVLVPVTVDRSISLFVLARMADRPEARFSAEAMSGLFTRVYVDERAQIARRLREQEVSGNVMKEDGGYRITPRGTALIAVARAMARLFDSRAGLVAPATIDIAKTTGGAAAR